MARPVCGRSFLPRADKRVSSPKHFRWAPICTTVLRDRHSMMLVGLNSGLTIANETAIRKEESRRLRNDSESHTTSLLDNRERNYRQSSVIVCSLLVYQTHNKVNTTSQHGVHCSAEDCVLRKQRSDGHSPCNGRETARGRNLAS